MWKAGLIGLALIGMAACSPRQQQQMQTPTPVARTIAPQPEAEKPKPLPPDPRKVAAEERARQEEIARQRRLEEEAAETQRLNAKANADEKARKLADAEARKTEEARRLREAEIAAEKAKQATIAAAAEAKRIEIEAQGKADAERKAAEAEAQRKIVDAQTRAKQADKELADAKARSEQAERDRLAAKTESENAERQRLEAEWKVQQHTKELVEEQKRIREEYERQYKRLEGTFAKAYAARRSPPIVVLVNQKFSGSAPVAIESASPLDSSIENRFTMWIRAGSQVTVLDHEVVRDKLARERALAKLSSDADLIKLIDRENELKSGVLVRINTRKLEDNRLLMQLKATSTNGEIIAVAQTTIPATDESIELGTRELARQTMQQLLDEWKTRDYQTVEVRLSGCDSVSEAPVVANLFRSTAGVVDARLKSAVGAGASGTALLEVKYRGDAAELYALVQQHLAKSQGLKPYKIEGASFALSREPEKPMQLNAVAVYYSGPKNSFEESVSRVTVDSPTPTRRPIVDGGAEQPGEPTTPSQSRTTLPPVLPEAPKEDDSSATPPTAPPAERSEPQRRQPETRPAKPLPPPLPGVERQKEE